MSNSDPDLTFENSLNDIIPTRTTVDIDEGPYDYEVSHIC